MPKSKSQPKESDAKKDGASSTPPFMKLVQPDDKLAVIVGSKPLPRTEITAKLWNYIKKHGLQDRKEKTKINTDDALKAVFNGKKSINISEMLQLVSQHLNVECKPQPKPQPEEKSITAPIVFNVKTSRGAKWRICCHILDQDDQDEDSINLEIAADEIGDDGEFLVEGGQGGLFAECSFDKEEFDDKPGEKECKKYISESMENTMGIARLQRVFNDSTLNAIARKINKWAILLLTDFFGLDKPRKTQDIASIAKTAKSERARLKAIEKLTDQAVLASIAKNDKDEFVRKEAVYKLTDQAVLASIAKNDKDEVVRKAAVSNLTDQAVLASIAKNDKNEDVRSAAAWHLTDQAVLASIAKNDKDEVVRRAAACHLTDQAVLASIAKNDKNGFFADYCGEKSSFPQ